MSSGRELCGQHGQLMEAQEDLKETQDRLHEAQEDLREKQEVLTAHFSWVRKVGYVAIATLFVIAGSLITTAYGVFKYGWDLALNNQLILSKVQAVEGKFSVVEGKIVKLEDCDKSLLGKVDELKRRMGINGRVKVEPDEDSTGGE